MIIFRPLQILHPGFSKLFKKFFVRFVECESRPLKSVQVVLEVERLWKLKGVFCQRAKSVSGPVRKRFQELGAWQSIGEVRRHCIDTEGSTGMLGTVWSM